MKFEIVKPVKTDIAKQRLDKDFPAAPNTHKITEELMDPGVSCAVLVASDAKSVVKKKSRQFFLP
jgi:hypothetical protein